MKKEHYRFSLILSRVLIYLILVILLVITLVPVWLLIVNATEIDFVKHEDHLDELVSEILKPHHVAVEYYTPMSRLPRED